MTPREPMAGLPDWEALLATSPRLWADARRNARNGPEVLIATSVGGFSALSLVESLLAVALTLRGARVHALLCDKVLPACLKAELPSLRDPAVLERYEIAQHLCDPCLATGRYVYDPLGLDVHEFSGLLTPEQRTSARTLAHETALDAIPSFRWNGWAVGEHAYAGALRYYATGNLENQVRAEAVVRRYFEGALLAAHAVQRLLQQHRFVAATFNHGIYSPQGVVGEVCRSMGVRVSNWNVAYRKKCFIFSQEDTYHHTLLSEPTAAWDDIPWTPEMEAQIVEYLKSRWSGARDWIWFHEKPDERYDELTKTLKLDPNRPVIGLLTNVMWDAQLHYRANAFPNMLSWVLETIRYFAARPDLQLLIRVHPAEVRGTLPSRQPLVPEIEKAFPTLPPNVFVIPPESAMSTYVAMARCNSVIIYGTKTGVELTSMGIPVVVAGEAWIRNKGLTRDASSKEDYFKILDELPLERRDDPAQLSRARRYAYHFFFRRMIPFRCMEPTTAWPPYRVAISRLEELVPGVDPGLDTVCDGILRGSPFIYPAERLGIHDA